MAGYDAASSALRAWQEYYVVIGAAAGALIGSLFIVASLGLGYLSAKHVAGMRVFLTPIIAHVAGVLVGCAVLVAPSLTWLSLEEVIGAGAVGGAGYATIVCGRAWRLDIGNGDRIWYGIVPIAAYAIAAAAVVLMALHYTMALIVLALAFATQLVAAIRNAWDMVLFFVARDRGSDWPSAGG